jgi:hypothetical protein
MVKKASPRTSRATISLKNLIFSRVDAKAAAAGVRSKWDAERECGRCGAAAVGLEGLASQ